MRYGKCVIGATLGPVHTPLPAGSPSRVIHLHVDAPPKPSVGQACNGCGVCCAAEPCPIGVIVSRQRVGRCQALQWSDDDRRYYCGMVRSPGQILPWLPTRLAPITSRLARRWIASATGCDASLEAENG